MCWVLGSSEGHKTTKKRSKIEKQYLCVFWDTLNLTYFSHKRLIYPRLYDIICNCVHKPKPSFMLGFLISFWLFRNFWQIPSSALDQLRELEHLNLNQVPAAKTHQKLNVAQKSNTAFKMKNCKTSIIKQQLRTLYLEPQPEQHIFNPSPSPPRLPKGLNNIWTTFWKSLEFLKELVQTLQVLNKLC